MKKTCGLLIIGFFLVAILPAIGAVASNESTNLRDTPSAITSGTTYSGSLSSTTQHREYKITVSSGAVSMRIVLDPQTMSGYDFDVYQRLGSAVAGCGTTSCTTYNNRGYTSGGEDLTITSPSSGTHYFRVQRYSGSGTFNLKVTVTYGTADTTAPVVSVTAPTDGTTVSGTVSVSCSATDNSGTISSYAIYIDSVSKATTSTYSWVTTSYTNAQHTVKCEAKDPSNNVGSDTHTVTVNNAAPPSNVLTSGTPVSGSLSASATRADYTIVVNANAESMRIVLDPQTTTYDFDLYQKFGAIVSGCSGTGCTTYDNRGYTSGGEDITISTPSAGTHYITVYSYSGSGTYTLTATVTYGSSGGSGWGTGGKYAVVSAISDYDSINDLSFCDEDALDVYNYLTGKGYEVKVFYDRSYASNSFKNIPASTGAGSSGRVNYATESNVRSAITSLASVAVSGSKFIYWQSSHGGATGTYAGAWETTGSSYTGNDPGTGGFSYLLMKDFTSSPTTELSTTDKSYSAQEMRNDLETLNDGVQIAIFIDACQSGGFIQEFQVRHVLANTVFVSTTCGVNGYGYDESSYSNGAFTYWVLEKGFIAQGNTTAEGASNYAIAQYSPSNGADDIRHYDSNTGSTWTI
jgi:hypothetical protein